MRQEGPTTSSPCGPIMERWAIGGLCGALWLAGCAHAPERLPGREASTAARANQRGVPVSVPFVSPASYEGFIRGELEAARGAPQRAVPALRAAIELGEDDPFLVA